LRASLEKQEVTLRSLMESDQPDETQVLAQIDKVAQGRANLEKSHVQMMLAVRRVLSVEQAKKLREVWPAPPLPRGPGFKPSGGQGFRPPGGPGPEGAPASPPPGGPPGQPQGTE
jgi:hypothetical protein